MICWEEITMAVMKIVNNNYPDYSSIENLLGYILSREHGWIGNVGSNLMFSSDNIRMAEQMRKVSSFYGKDNRRLIRHMIISYDPYYESWISPEQRFYNVCCCMEIYFSKYQWIVAMHEKEGDVHIHIVYNMTNVYSGEQLHEGLDFFEQLSYGFSCHGFVVNGKMRHLSYKVCYGESPRDF